MRDLVLAAILFGSIPFILRRPEIGMLVWNWLAFMNPHRLTYGFAFNTDWSQMIVLATLVSILFSKDKKMIPWSPLVVVWVLFVVWVNIATLFALYPSGAFNEWDRFMKIQLMVFLTLMVMGRPERIRWLVWVITLSIAFYGIKGGFFTLMTGGRFMVWGPARTFIAGNNEIALAIIIVVPLLWFLREQLASWWLRTAMLGGIALCLAAVISTYSRGAFLATGAMLLFLFLKSKKKLLLAPMLIILSIGTISFMPDQWVERMETIQTYEEDGSAMGRINAWWMAYNLAKDRPLVGGGFSMFRNETFRKYAPEPNDVHDAHSIYFEVLGEQGFVGLGLYLALALGIIISLQRTQRRAKRLPDLKWVADLAAMIQVSFVGFGVGGLFLGLAYFDLPYQLFAIAVLLSKYVEQEELVFDGHEPDRIDSQSVDVYADMGTHAGRATRA